MTKGQTLQVRSLELPFYEDDYSYKIRGLHSHEPDMSTPLSKLIYKDVDLCDTCLSSLAEWFSLCRLEEHEA